MKILICKRHYYWLLAAFACLPLNADSNCPVPESSIRELITPASAAGSPLITLLAAKYLSPSPAVARPLWELVGEKSIELKTYKVQSTEYPGTMMVAALKELSLPAFDPCCSPKFIELSKNAVNALDVPADIALEPLVNARLRNAQFAEVSELVDGLLDLGPAPFRILAAIVQFPGTPRAMRDRYFTIGKTLAEQDADPSGGGIGFLNAVKTSMTKEAWALSALKVDTVLEEKALKEVQGPKALEILRERRFLLDSIDASLASDIPEKKARLLSDPRFKPVEHGPPAEIREEMQRAQKASQSVFDAVGFVETLSDPAKRFYYSTAMAARFWRPHPQQTRFFLRVAEAESAKLAEADTLHITEDLILVALSEGLGITGRGGVQAALGRLKYAMSDNKHENLETYRRALSILFGLTPTLSVTPQATWLPTLAGDARIVVSIAQSREVCGAKKGDQR